MPSQAREFASTVTYLQKYGRPKEYSEALIGLLQKSKAHLDKALEDARVDADVAAVYQKQVLINAIDEYNKAVALHNKTGQHAYKVCDALCTVLVERESFDAWVHKYLQLPAAEKETKESLTAKLNDVPLRINGLSANIQTAQRRYNRYKKKNKWFQKLKRFGQKTWHELGGGRHPQKVADDESYKASVMIKQKEKLETQKKAYEDALKTLLCPPVQVQEAAPAQKRDATPSPLQVRKAPPVQQGETDPSQMITRAISLEPYAEAPKPDKKEVVTDIVAREIAHNMTVDTMSCISRINKAAPTVNVTPPLMQVPSSMPRPFIVPTIGAASALPNIRTPFGPREARILNAHSSISQALGTGPRYPGRFIVTADKSVRFTFDDPQTSSFKIQRIFSKNSLNGGSIAHQTIPSGQVSHNVDYNFGASGDSEPNFLQRAIRAAAEVTFCSCVVLTKKTVRGVHDLFSEKEFLHEGKISAHKHALKQVTEILHDRNCFMPSGGLTSRIQAERFSEPLKNLLVFLKELWMKRGFCMKKLLQMRMREQQLHDFNEQDVNQYRVQFSEKFTTMEKTLKALHINVLLQKIERICTGRQPAEGGDAVFASMKLLDAFLKGQEISEIKKQEALAVLSVLSRDPLFTVGIGTPNQYTEALWLKSGVPQKLFFGDPQVPEVFSANILCFGM